MTEYERLCWEMAINAVVLPFWQEKSGQKLVIILATLLFGVLFLISR